MRLMPVLVLAAMCFLGCATAHTSAPGPLSADDLLVVLENGSFDGTTLDARLLVGATRDGQVVNQSAWPVLGVTVDSARRCDGGEPVALYSVSAGRVGKPRGSSQTLLFRGDWYGRDIKALPVLASVEKCAELKALIPGDAVGEPGRDVILVLRLDQRDGATLLRVERAGTTALPATP